MSTEKSLKHLKSKDELLIANVSNYTEQNKLRKFQKTMQHKNTKANNYSIFIYVFRYIDICHRLKNMFTLSC